MRHAVVASSFLWLASVGCGFPPLEPLHRVEHIDLPVTVNRDLDLLFLIDDSPSMADQQANLAASFPKLLDVLSTVPGGLPNVHIGVVTSDMGAKGADGVIAPQSGAIGQGGCANAGKNGAMQLFGAPVTGSPFLSDLQPPDPTLPRTTNYTGNLSDVFAQMAKAGAGGCGFEQHLEAMKHALEPTNAENAGFLRPDAYLAVIFLADEDDCSMEHTTMLTSATDTLGPQQSFRCTRFGVLCDDGGATPDAMNQVGPKSQCHPNDASAYLTNVADYAAFLKGLKQDPNNVIVAGILGTPEPFATELRISPSGGTEIPALAHSCTYVDVLGKTEVADPAIRLRSFLDEFPDRSTFAPICEQDLSGGLQQIGDLLKTVLVGDPCIQGTLADVDPKAPGLQDDCAVSAVTDRGTPAQSETVLPRCTPEDASATNQPCWHLATDPVSCPNRDHLVLEVEGLTMLPSDAHVIASCPIEPS